MHHHLRNTLLALVVMLMLPAMTAVAGQCERLVATGDPDHPPYLWRDPGNPERLIGASADLLGQLGEDLGVKVEIIPAGAWSRVEEEVASGRIDLLLGAAATSARRKTLNFIEPALFVLPSSVWVRKGQALAYGGWNDLYAHTGVSLAESRLAREFDLLSGAYLPLEEVSSLSKALRKLQRGEVTYLLHEQLPTQAVAERLGMLGDIQALEPPLTSEGLYLAISLDSACNEPELRKRLSSRITELIAGGLPERLLQRNFELWQAQWKPSAKAANQ